MRRRALLLFTVMLLLAGTLFVSGCTKTSPGFTTTVAGSGCDSRAIAMSLPGTVNDQVTASTQFKVYCVYVPAGTSSLTVTLSNLQDDLDLYMGYGSYSSIEGDNYDWFSDNSGTLQDSITVSSPQAGNYYIQVYNALDSSSTFQLQATIDGGGMVTTTTVGGACDSRATAMSLPGTVNDQLSAGYQQYKVYCVYVPAGRSSLTVTLSNLVADFDLYIGYGSYSSIEGDNYDWYSRGSGTASESISISNPQAGNYYLQVTSYGGDAGTFRLQVS